MKVTKSQFSLVAETLKDFCVVLFGALVVSGIFSQEPFRWGSLLLGILLLNITFLLAMFFKKKGNSDG